MRGGDKIEAQLRKVVRLLQRIQHDRRARVIGDGSVRVLAFPVRKNESRGMRTVDNDGFAVV